MTYDLARLKEHVLFPVDSSGATARDAILRGGVLLLTAGFNGDQGADRVTTGKKQQRSSLVY